MTQLTLPDPGADRIGKFQGPQSGAAETQRAAAIAAEPSTGSARRMVLDAIADGGHFGATDEEIVRYTELNPSTQRPRRVELREDGWIEDSGGRRKTRSGRSAVVWTLTEAGARLYGR